MYQRFQYSSGISPSKTKWGKWLEVTRTEESNIYYEHYKVNIDHWTRSGIQAERQRHNEKAVLDEMKSMIDGIDIVVSNYAPENAILVINPTTWDKLMEGFYDE